MRKSVFCLLLALLLTLIIPGPVLAVDDSTPPDIYSVTISTHDLFGGENLTFTIDGFDDISGIGHLMFEFSLEGDPQKRLTIEFDNHSGSNSFSVSYKIPEKTAPGLWKFSFLQVWDNAYNLQSYGRGEGSFGQLDFTVKERADFDTTPPVLVSIQVNNKVITLPGKIEVTAVVTDNKSSTVRVQVTYLIADSQYAINLSKTSGNTYKGSLELGEFAKYQPAVLGFIVLEDESGNQAWYSYNPDQYPFGETSLILNTNIDVSFSNAVDDQQPPELLDYRYSSSSVAAPGIMSITFDTRDDVSGVAYLRVHFVGYDENASLISHLLLNPQYSSSRKKFVSEVTFDQYYPKAIFSITRIEIVDYAGNRNIYSIDPQPGEFPLEEKILTLTKAITGGVSSGTMSDNYLAVIKDAKDGEVITLDSTANSLVKKEAFDAIRGTNKTLTLVNDGIQWIFKGTDVNRQAKDINTRIKINKLDDYGNEVMLECFTQQSNGLVIEFAPNGTLPGKALIKIKADYTFRSYIGERDLYVYRFQDSENTLEAIAERIEMTPDGYYQFFITHNSKYIISSRKAKASHVTRDNTALNQSFSQAAGKKKGERLVPDKLDREFMVNRTPPDYSGAITTLPEKPTNQVQTSENTLPDTFAKTNPGKAPARWYIAAAALAGLIIVGITLRKPLMKKLEQVSKTNKKE